MTTTAELLDTAAGHLHAAAARADELGHRRSSPSILAFAGQIRLTAAGLSQDPDPDPPVAPGRSIAEHLGMGLSLLDRINPLDGPPDLQLWAWHVAELVRIAKAGDAT
jgi:hypothetical protein